MGREIIIDDGLRTYDIKNKEGKLLGQFSFNPSDTNIVKRYKEVVRFFDTVDYTKYEKSEENEDIGDNLNTIDEIVYEKFDYLLNSEASKDFFSIMGPFTPLESGMYFLESVINAIGQAIQSETGARVQKLQKKVKKYTSKYHA